MIKLTFNSQPIDYVEEYKYLGIWIDAKLSFNRHIRNTISKVCFRLSKLSRIRNCLSKETALTMYKCMILPVLDYGDIFFHHCANKILITKLQTLQNSAIRTISKMPKRTNTNEEEENLGLLSLNKRRTLHCIEFALILSLEKENCQSAQANTITTRAHSSDRRQLICFRPKKTVAEKSLLPNTEKMEFTSNGTP